MKNYLPILLLISLLGCDLPDNQVYEGLYPVKYKGRYGYIDQNGQMVIEPIFDHAERFSEGLAAVQIDSLWGFIDEVGNFVVNPKYDVVNQFSDGMCAVATIQDKYTPFIQYIDKTGTTRFSSDNSMGDFRNGLLLSHLNDTVVYLDKNGVVAINTNSTGLGESFYDGLAKLFVDGNTQYIDTLGNIVFELPGGGKSNFSEGLASASLNGGEAYVNKKGETVFTKSAGMSCYSFAGGLAKIGKYNYNDKSSLYGFVNHKGELVIPYQFSRVSNFSNGLAYYLEGDKYGFINKNGRKVIKPKFDFVAREGFRNGLCWVHQGSVAGYIDRKGDFVWQDNLDYRYDQIDYADWALDSLNISLSITPSQKIIWTKPKFTKKDTTDSFKLIVSNETTDFDGKYLGKKVYLINGNNDTLSYQATDGYITLVPQAINESGNWQDIAKEPMVFCGNSYHDVRLAPQQYQIYSTPVFNGEFNTTLRLRLQLGFRDTLYSNQYPGKINRSQFVTKVEDTY